MDPVDIGKAYNQITHLWQRDGFNSSNGIEQHERAIAFLKNKGSALDVGCGCSGRFIDLLLSKGFEPEGVDISSEMVRLAREKHTEIEIHQEDICKWEITKKYDFITAWDSIWHVPLDQQEQVITKLISSLNPDGILIFTCGGTDKRSELRDDFMGPEVYYSTLGMNAYLNLFSSLGCICRHLEYDQYPELHTYFIVQKTHHAK